MKLHMFSLLFILIPVSLGFSSPASAACDGDGEVQFLCGPLSPEDLYPVPESPWVVVSGMEDEGYLYIADTRDHSSSVMFPGANSASRQDRQTYGACPGVPNSQFRPHGLSLRPGSDGLHTLYVVAHGGREAVEVFNLDVSGSAPALTWVGCLLAPQGVSLNSVTALPGGAIAVTNFNTSGGELWEWQPGSGWAQVPGSEMNGPNGIVSSADGRWFYIGGWSDEALIRLSRGQTPVRKDRVEVGFHIDNVRWAPDGSLLVAGQYGSERASIGRCLNGGECEGVSSRVARVDPNALTAEQLIDYPSNALFIFGTVAVQLGQEIWFGGIAGAERIARFPLK